MPRESALKKIKNLQAQIEKLQAKAIEEALDKLKAIQTDLAIIPAASLLPILRAAGHQFRLAEAGSKPGKTGIKRPVDPDAPCKICEFVTKPHHDGRMHRSQGKSKKPFTAGELKELELTKV